MTTVLPDAGPYSGFTSVTFGGFRNAATNHGRTTYWHLEKKTKFIRNTYEYLAKGRIALFSSLAAENVSVRTFARDGRRTMCYALMRGYVTMCRYMSPSKVPLSGGLSRPPTETWFPGSTPVNFRTAPPSLQPSLHSLRVFPTHTGTQRDRHHTDHDTCNICSSRLHLCAVCTRYGLKT